MNLQKVFLTNINLTMNHSNTSIDKIKPGGITDLDCLYWPPVKV